MTRTRIALAALLGPVLYLAADVGASLLVAEVFRATRVMLPSGWTPYAAGLLAGVVVPVVAGAGRAARFRSGVWVVVPTTVVVAVLAAVAGAVAEQYGGPPPSVWGRRVVVHPAVVLGTAAVVVLLLRRGADRPAVGVPDAD